MQSPVLYLIFGNTTFLIAETEKMPALKSYRDFILTSTINILNNSKRADAVFKL